MELARDAIVEGKVTGITKFGAFVSLGEGKSGLVHISEISDSFVTDISQFVSVGDTVRVRILAIDDDGKIRLSIKKAAPRAETAPRPISSERPVRRPPSPAPAPAASEGTSLDDMLKRFMSESSANQSPASSRRSGYEKRSAKKPNRRNYDD